MSTFVLALYSLSFTMNMERISPDGSHVSSTDSIKFASGKREKSSTEKFIQS